MFVISEAGTPVQYAVPIMAVISSTDTCFWLQKQHDTAEVTAELVQFFDKNKEYALWTSKCLKALPVEENKSKLAVRSCPSLLPVS